MKYFANYTTTDGTTMSAPIEDTNKSRLLRDIREIAKGNATPNNFVSFGLWDEKMTTIYSGYIQNKKLHYVTRNGEEKITF